ncbi:T6SS phospholipase effector Tle1-like catalytic domain-containing protein [Aspergillus melleus]|uniref:T6SS phospholipase effector Tle1-like catalytic domain-containing protein n=1 Tax=Aspergillus melleus TaxID=138277 RepID=UPI001E8E01F2|nr:uncharacterized protein LDX57_011008 [Aspergillus melleus]KAH8433374.1 hypothetical protein LDX57_011008 [Aspergillus melleus]
MSDPSDCGCPPQRELILCFDGTGNTFRADGSESNILKIFRMLDRKRENRFCYYQPGIGKETTPGTFANAALRPFSNLPTHTIFEQAFASSFDEHVFSGYKFLARRWQPGAKIYLFGFSRGAYTARFLNEMLDFVGLLSADNEELIPFVWQAFTSWKFAPPGKERDDAEASLRISRDTLCRSIGWVDFLGLFDTVSSVASINWDFETSNPIQPNPKTMRHAVSIDERRIKFQPVLFQDARGRRGETRLARVSTWAARSNSDLMSQAPFTLNPDFEEVYFAGDHSDVGGGWATDKWPVSQIPLMWMVQEATLAGLTFEHHQMTQMGCFDPHVEEYDPDIVRRAASAELHDSLHYSDPGKTLETMFWRVLECFPFKRPKVAPDGSVQDSRWHARGQRRPLPDNARIHSSVLYRLKHDPEYRPYNLGLGNRSIGDDGRVDIGKWQRVSHHGLCEYFIRIFEGRDTTNQNREREREQEGQREVDERQQEEQIREEINRGRLRHGQTV